MAAEAALPTILPKLAQDSGKYLYPFVCSVSLKNLCLEGQIALPLTASPMPLRELGQPYPFT